MDARLEHLPENRLVTSSPRENDWHINMTNMYKPSMKWHHLYLALSVVFCIKKKKSIFFFAEQLHFSYKILDIGQGCSVDVLWLFTWKIDGHLKKNHLKIKGGLLYLNWAIVLVHYYQHFKAEPCLYRIWHFEMLFFGIVNHTFFFRFFLNLFEDNNSLHLIHFK